MDELTKLGADVNMRDGDGVPAVMHAVMEVNWCCMLELIKYGADLQEVDSQAEILTDVVKQCYFGYLHEKLNELVKSLELDEEKTIALRLATNMGDLDTEAKLEGEGADVNWVTKVTNLGLAAFIIKDLSYLVDNSRF